MAVVVSALAVEAPPLLDTPMAAQKPWWTLSRIPLFETGGPPPPVYVTWLQVRDPLVLLASPEIRIPVWTDRFRPNVTEATLAMENSGCEYRSSPDMHRWAGATLRLLAGPGCNPLQGTPSRRLKLTVHAASRQRLMIFGFSQGTRAESLPASTIEVVGLQDDGPPYPILQGKYVAPAGPAGLRRIDLLAFTWQLDASPAWIWLGVGAAGVLALAGLLIFPAGNRLDGSRRSAALRAGAGAFCLAGSWALLYAILVPPFQTPDEPNHLLSYGVLTSNDPLLRDAEGWARRTHFERITFHTNERFRPADIGSPWPVAWNDHVSPADQPARSKATVLVWTAVDSILGSRSGPSTLLVLRLVNALLFAAAVGIAAIALACATAARAGHLLTFVFLLVPTLPFFAVGVSNHAILVAAYVLIAGGAGALFLGGGGQTAAALALGSGTGLLIGGGISALPTAVMVGFVMVARALLGSGEAGRTARFWMLFAVSGCGVSLLVAPGGTPDMLSKAGPYRDWLLRAVNLAPLLLLAVSAAGFAADAALRKREGSRSDPRPRLESATVAGLRLAAAALLTGMAGSLVAAYPTVRPMGLMPRWPTVFEYVREVLAAGLTIGRISGPDWLLSSSFWAGFGWLDTFPGEWLVNLLTGLTTLMLVVVLVRLAALRDYTRAAWLLLFACGWTLTLALYAAGGLAARTSVHGRYLVGLYLCGLIVSWSALAWTPRAAAWRPGPLALFTGTGAIHAFCLWFILARYF